MTDAKKRPPLARETLSTREAGERLGVSRKTMERHIRDGNVPGTKVGRKWFIPLSSIDKIIKGG